MPQPLLNLFHRHAIRQKNRGTAMTEVMKSNHPHPFSLQKTWESVGNVGWTGADSKLIDANIIQKIRAVRFSAKPSEFILLSLFSKKKLLKCRHQRQRSKAGFCLGGIRSQVDFLPIHFYCRDCVVDRQSVALKVNSAPPQSDKRLQGLLFLNHIEIFKKLITF